MKFDPNNSELLLFYDTETSGLPDWHQPSDAPQQPHIVELAAVLVDDVSRERIASFSVIVQPHGWTIPDDVVALHGITTAHALAVGVPEKVAIQMLLQLEALAVARVAHNESFDMRIGRIAIKRFLSAEDADDWKARPAICTQKLSTPVLDLAPTDKMVKTGRTWAKSAKLSEAYEFLLGKPMENAHRAMADVDASIGVWFALKERGLASIDTALAKAPAKAAAPGKVSDFRAAYAAANKGDAA